MDWCILFSSIIYESRHITDAEDKKSRDELYEKNDASTCAETVKKSHFMKSIARTRRNTSRFAAVAVFKSTEKRITGDFANRMSFMFF